MRNMVWVLMLSLLLGACSTTKTEPSEAYKDQTPQEIYHAGRKALQNRDYSEAVKRFEALDVQYPYGEQTEKAKTKVKGGELVHIHVVLETTHPWQGEAIPLQVVYEDEALLVINKEAGLVVHPGAGNPQGTLLNAILYHYPELRALPRAGILHRLDKETSGLLLIAKTHAALKSLSQQLRKRKIVREYIAIANGQLISGATITTGIERDPHQRQRMTVSEVGKTAITHYRIMKRFRFHTMVKVKLETGRTHQIRVHFAHIKHALVGDPLYGRLQIRSGMSSQLVTALRQFKRQALHAYALSFSHPSHNDILHFESDLPADMSHLISILQRTNVSEGDSR